MIGGQAGGPEGNDLRVGLFCYDGIHICVVVFIILWVTPTAAGPSGDR